MGMVILSIDGKPYQRRAGEIAVSGSSTALSLSRIIWDLDSPTPRIPVDHEARVFAWQLRQHSPLLALLHFCRMPIATLAMRVTSPMRHPLISFYIAPHYRVYEGDTEDVRESLNTCRHFFQIVSCRACLRLPLAPPALAPFFWRDGVHPDPPVPSHWHDTPNAQLVDKLQLPSPWRVRDRWGHLP
jgi:hypothetical protein